MTLPNEINSALFLHYLFNSTTAVTILVLGYCAANIAKRIILQKVPLFNSDVTSSNFLATIAHVAIMVVATVTALTQLGVPTTPLITAVGAAGLAIGLALQQSLANVASGFMIIILRLFRIGDFIDTNGVTGTVEEINIFNVVLRTPNNEEVIIPNAKLTSEKIINRTAKQQRRIEIILGISYSADIRAARTALLTLLLKTEKVLPNPAPSVTVNELTDDAVDLALCAWVNNVDYQDVKNNLSEAIKYCCDQHQIALPIQELTVTMQS